MLTGRTIVITANRDENFFRFRLPLLRALLDAGALVHVAAPDTGVLAGLPGRLPGLRVHKLPPVGRVWDVSALLGQTLALRCLLQELAPDLAHSFTHQANIVLRWAAPVGLPVIGSVTGLGWPFQGRSILARTGGRLLGRLYARSSGPDRPLLFQNPDDLRLFRTHGLSGRSPVLVAPTGVDTGRFRPGLADPAIRRAKRSALGFTPDDFVILQASRFLREKGVLTVAQAVSGLEAEEGGRVRFVLAGHPDPGNPGSLDPSELIGGKTGRRSSRLTVLPWQTDMAALWPLSDAGLLASTGEGLPASLLEAAACGLPLLAADAPGNREVVRPGLTGLLMSPDDPEALAAAALRLAGDPALVRALGTAARADVLSRFRAETAAGWHVEYYAGLLKR